MKKHPLIVVALTAAGLSALFFIVVLLLSLVLPGRSADTLRPLTGNHVALVKIEGVLVASERIVDELNEYADDSSIKAIVVRVDSPGGGVVPSQEIYKALLDAKKKGKKVVVSMGSVAASGGYYIAAAADRIVANPGTLTGSIGVKMEFASFERLLEKIGIKGMVLKAGEYKDVGSPFRDMTPQERRLLQAVIDDVHNQFIDDVAAGRNLPVADVRAVADGRIFTGRQARELKLVDHLGDLNDSIDLAGELAGIKGKPRVVSKTVKKRFFDYLKEESASWVVRVLDGLAGSNGSPLRLFYRW